MSRLHPPLQGSGNMAERANRGRSEGWEGTLRKPILFNVVWMMPHELIATAKLPAQNGAHQLSIMDGEGLIRPHPSLRSF